MINTQGKSANVAPLMVLLCMLSVLIKAGNSDGGRLIVCIGATLMLGASLFLDKQQYSLREWLPGLTLLIIASVHIISHNLIWEEALLWGTLALSYWAVLLCVSRFSQWQVTILLVGLFCIVLFELTYGVLNRVTGDVVTLGFWEKIYYSDSATGTFINRNHYAGYLAMTWPIALATIALFTRRQRSLRISLSAVVSLLFLFGLILSKSRMGLVCGLIGVSIYWRWRAKNGVDMSRWLKWGGGVFAATFLIMGALWIGIEDIGKRYTLLGEAALVRLAIWKSMFDLPLELWIKGIGVNEFEQRFPIVQPVQLISRYIYAHNDYLQLILEIGLIGVVLLLGSLWFFGHSLSATKLDSKRQAAWGGLVAIIIHELVDFNLHMPGLAVVWFALLGLVFNPVAYSVRTKVRTESVPPLRLNRTKVFRGLKVND